MIISLTGFMGCGKSSVGRELSRLLCCPFTDLDDVIAEKAGRSIPEIFVSEGEAAFRQMEYASLKQILNIQETQQVLALGGGTVMTEECAEMVHDNTLCIYLRASVETLLEHLAGEAEGRPMLSEGCHSERPKGDEESALRSRIEDLMARRAATYEKTAHVIIDTDGKSIGNICNEIIKAIS